jgi:tetratricopeptide (TPR) repeat protein
MTRKPKNAECVETLIDLLPQQSDSSCSEGKDIWMAQPPNGIDYFKDLQDALTEEDIIQLREQLHEIFDTGDFREENKEAMFDLAEEMKFSDFKEGFENMGFDTLFSKKPLPRIHIHHHQRATSENMHPFYLEQFISEQTIPDISLEVDMEEEFLDLGEALMENDILNLRETLNQLSRSSSNQRFSVEEIDNYLTGNMLPSELEAFESELDFNDELNREVELCSEVEEALLESDVINIRKKLEKIIESQHSTQWKVEDIDAFLNKELPENEMDAFIAELELNDDLKAEVNLSRNLEKAFAEKDIHHLRNELNHIASEISEQNSLSLAMFPEKQQKIRRNSTFAAALLALIGLSSVIWQNHEKNRDTYDSFFKQPMAISSYRSAGEVLNEDLSKGLDLYNKTDYVSALLYFDKVIKTDYINPMAHYWAGLSDQQIQHYPEALKHFQQVIIHQNNLYVEQAEWFSVMCTLKISGKQSVGSQLEAVINRKGYYYKDALNLRSRLMKND